MAIGGKGFASGSAGIAGGGVKHHACLRRNGAAVGSRNHDGLGARRSGAGPVRANVVAQQSAKISAALFGGGDRRNFRSADVAAGSLVTEESEQLVLDDRAAERSAELVPTDGRIDAAERVSRVEEIVAEIFEGRAVQFVGAGFRGGLQQRARHVAELRVVVASCDFEFFEDVRVGIDHGDTQDVAVILSAIQQEAIRISHLAIDRSLLVALLIFRAGCSGCGLGSASRAGQSD